MGLLDSVLGAALGGGNNAGGGTQGALLNAVIGMLSQGGGAAGGLGGLGGLVSKFTQGGMGDVVNSWVGTGQNMPVSADQISNVLGGDMIGNLAKQLGMNQGDIAGQLSQMLPGVVDKLTPNGQIPQGDVGGMGSLGDIAGMLGGLLKR
jgi:uncharacterized protein YidB (DUF937 family)